MSLPTHCTRCSHPVPALENGNPAPKFCLHCGAALNGAVPLGPPENLQSPAAEPSEFHLIDEACDRFEQAWLNNGLTAPEVRDFWPVSPAANFSPDAANALVRELVLLDLHYRRIREMTLPWPEMYHERFPDCREAIESAFALSGLGTDTPKDNGSAVKAGPSPETTATPPHLLTSIISRIGPAPKNHEADPPSPSNTPDSPMRNGEPAEPISDLLLRTDTIHVPKTNSPDTSSSALSNPPAGGSRPDSVVGSIQQLGPYRIVKSLGRGGSGEVYLASDSVLHRQVAIKVCDVASRGHDQYFQRFLREARIGASLDHPSLCRIIDVQREHGVFYIVMEYVEGQDLARMLAQRSGPMPVAEACHYGSQLVEVLKYLSRHNVVHRDIKPGNVMVREDRSIKLLDLGLGRLLDAQEESQLTREGDIVGTVYFMPPEQCEGAGTVTPAIDIYAAGVTLYNLLTRNYPFGGSGQSMLQVFAAIMQKLPEDPRTFRPDLPDDLAQLILQMLAKQSRDRPDHDAILKVLRRYAHPASSAPGAVPEEGHTDFPLTGALQRNTLMAFLEHAAQPAEDAGDIEDELMRLLPRRDGKVYLGEYLLKRPLGRAGQFNTYEGEMPFGGVKCFIRTLPPNIDALAPERLQHLLAEHGRLMQISARSAYLSGITFLGRAELKRSVYPTVYYTVEPWIEGTSLQTIIDRAEDLSHRDARRYLSQAMTGLTSLHEQQFLHGNLHPAKLLLDEVAREVLITDLTQIRRISQSESRLDEDAVITLDDDPAQVYATVGLPQIRPAVRRQYEAPELFVSNERPNPNTEQYALGVIFIEALTSHIGYVNSAHDNLEHFTKAREDLEDRLDEISGKSPGLTQVLWKMVKLNPRSRFSNLREARRAILRIDQHDKRPRIRKPAPSSKPSRTAEPSPPEPKSRGEYDIFVSYRREGGAAMARALLERLERCGKRVFLDVKSLDSGRFDTRLLRYIKNSRNFLLVLTPGALDRCRDSIDDWLRIEISHAIKCRRNIVPVFAPDFEMPADEALPHAFKSLRSLNGIVYDHLQFDGMIEKLQTFLK